MRAIAFAEFGGPEVLRVLDVEPDRPAAGEIRVRVHAAGANPTDAMFRSGRRSVELEREPPPWTPGQELSGVVESIGGGVTGWKIGQRVAAITRPRPGRRGAQAELAVVWADGAALVPDGVDLLAAATLPLNGLTARQALELLCLPPTATIAITGAAGGVGGYAIQLARVAGYETIGVAAQRDETLVRRLGARCFVPAGDDAVSEVRRSFPAGVDGVIDAALVGASMLAAIRDGGGYVGLRGLDKIISERGVTLHRASIQRWQHEGRRLSELLDLVQDNELTLRVAQTFRPDDGPEVHRRLEEGGLRGRLVIRFDEPDCRERLTHPGATTAALNSHHEDQRVSC